MNRNQYIKLAKQAADLQIKELKKIKKIFNKSLDKRQGSSDWNKDINDFSEKQLEYAANDVVY